MAWYAKFKDIEGNSNPSTRDGVPQTDIDDLTYEPERDDSDPELPPPPEPARAVDEISLGFTAIKDSAAESGDTIIFEATTEDSRDGMPRTDVDDLAFEVRPDPSGEPDPLPPFEPNDPLPSREGGDGSDNGLDIILWDVVG